MKTCGYNITGFKNFWYVFTSLYKLLATTNRDNGDCKRKRSIVTITSEDHIVVIT